jgi:hypothetical protein
MVVAAIAKNSMGKRKLMMVRVMMISIRVGTMLKVAILRIVANDWEPLETILIIFPVSLYRWKAIL